MFIVSYSLINPQLVAVVPENLWKIASDENAEAAELISGRPQLPRLCAESLCRRAAPEAAHPSADFLQHVFA